MRKADIGPLFNNLLDLHMELSAVGTVGVIEDDDLLLRITASHNDGVINWYRLEIDPF